MLVLRELKLDESIFADKMKQTEVYMRLIKNKIDDLNNTMKSTDNYLEKFLPFNLFCQ